jgi:hypothetical protein
MDGDRFDSIIRTLATRATRRRALGLLAALTGLHDREGAAKGRRTGKARKQRKDTQRVKNAKAGQAHKEVVCHYDAETDTYQRISISGSGKAVDKHLANPANFQPAAVNGCCTDDECEEEGQQCDRGQCVDCRGNADCDPCNTCVSGQCQAVPNLTFACDGSALRQICCGNPLACTDTLEIGVCVNGACSCGSHDYDSDANRCRCNPTEAARCGSLCCRVGQVCTTGTEATAAFGCVACP